MDPELLYLQLRELVAQMPDFSKAGGSMTAEKLGWLGKAAHLVVVANNGAGMDPISFRTASDNLSGGVLHDTNAHQVAVIVHRALATAESKAPAAVRGGFIPAGGTFDVFQITSQLFAQARSDILLVDPYMDSVIFTDFVPLIPEKVQVYLLCDSFYTKPEAVAPAAERWARQYGATRPLAIRMSDPRRLHDRLAMIDGRGVWSLTQSFKDFAKRAPGSIQKLDQDIAEWKLATYAQEWGQAKPI